MSSCVDDLDESRSLRLKSLLSEYFDKRRDRSQTLAPLDVEELNKYNVKHRTVSRSFQPDLCLKQTESCCLPVCFFLSFTVVGLGESDQSGYQVFSRQPE